MTSGIDTALSEVINEVNNSISRDYNVDKGQIHIERIYKV